MSEGANMAVARASWPSLPDWVEALARACDLRSQAAVARDMSRSPSLVNMVLKARYSGDMERVEELVRGALMNGVVSCPAQGTLPQHECVLWREKAKTFQSGNPIRTRMYRFCNRCPRFTKENEDAV